MFHEIYTQQTALQLHQYPEITSLDVNTSRKCSVRWRKSEIPNLLGFPGLKSDLN